MAAADPLSLVGSRVANLRFDECVDAGSFGILYRGARKDRTPEERVAIKCYRLTRLAKTNDAMRAGIAARFESELPAIAQRSETNADIVRALATGALTVGAERSYSSASGKSTEPRSGERVPYVVLPWLEGRLLSADLEERRARGAKGRSLHEAMDVLEGGARALAHAHAVGIVHRDVQPSNLMLVHSRGTTRLKLLDLGIAKILFDDPLIGFAEIVTTVDGDPLCSPSYGAPEQFSPDVGPVGAPADVYSLALVLLELMRGDRVRPAETVAQGLVAALDPKTCSPTPLALGLDVPKPVDELIARAVARDPRERPRDAGAFWDALNDVAGPRSLKSTVLGVPPLPGLPEVTSPPSVVPVDALKGTLVMIDAPRPAAPAVNAAPPMTGRAMASPLAASLGPGVASPLASAPRGSAPPAIIMPKRAPPPDDDVAFRPTQLAVPLIPAPVPAPAPPPVTTPPPLALPLLAAAPRPRGNGVAIGLLLLLLLVVVAGAGFLWHFQHAR